MSNLEFATKIIRKKLNDNCLTFQESIVIQGIWCDFFVPSQRLIIQITEKEHDHGEAYYAEAQEIEHLHQHGFRTICIPLPEASRILQAISLD